MSSSYYVCFCLGSSSVWTICFKQRLWIVHANSHSDNYPCMGWIKRYNSTIHDGGLHSVRAMILRPSNPKDPILDGEHLFVLLNEWVDEIPLARSEHAPHVINSRATELCGGCCDSIRCELSDAILFHTVIGDDIPHRQTQPVNLIPAMFLPSDIHSHQRIHIIVIASSRQSLLIIKWACNFDLLPFKLVLQPFRQFYIHIYVYWEAKSLSCVMCAISVITCAHDMRIYLCYPCCWKHNDHFTTIWILLLASSSLPPLISLFYLFVPNLNLPFKLLL